jgi:formate--tetrahydrofolate ligase
VRQFGVPAVVAINHFTADSDAEVQVIKDAVAAVGSEAILCSHWAEGGAGTEELAHKVVEIVESGAAQFAPLYPSEMPLFEKINTIATRIYRADEAIADSSVRKQLHQWEKDGFGHLPVCMAKTQYSFTTDPTQLGAPTHHTVPVREVRLAAGAGFIVAICGDIMTMPGLPKVPSAEQIHLDKNGQIEGLF